MEYFNLTAKPTDPEPATTEAALRAAWNACGAVACPKCGVQPWQYCRDRTGGQDRVTRFHRPRQDAANARRILAGVGINSLSWAKSKGSFRWDDRRMPAV